jgi:uncharacterized tellurite resistance protein B-like protein
MAFWKWLGLAGHGSDEPEDGLQEIERALERMEASHARYIACFAYILTRAARADHEISEAEMAEMQRLVTERGGITPDEAQIVVGIARAHGHRVGGTEDFLVTREFNRIATREQKLALLDCLFAVTATDASILTVEDNEIRRVANELKLEHGDYIAVRSRHLQNLNVLRPDAGA